jgi:G3E family GTPase
VRSANHIKVIYLESHFILKKTCSIVLQVEIYCLNYETMSDDSFCEDDVPTLINLAGSLQIDHDEPLAKVPVTILTGFLGSGKTSLIQFILKSPDHGKKIAVIENEFSGTSSVTTDDVSQFTGSQAEREGLSIETLIARNGVDDSNLTDLIELPNGCICCTVKDNLVEALETLVNKKRDLDYIIIECSGLANPGPIASIFWLDEAVESRLKLDGVVACVDARNIHMQLRETSSKNTAEKPFSYGDEAAQQIAYADRIIVNKIDLLSQKSSGNTSRTHDLLDDVLHQIRRINNTAQIRATTFSQISDLEWVLDTDCFSVERAQDIEKVLSSTNDERHDTHKCPSMTCITCAKNTKEALPLCSPCAILEASHVHTSAIRTIALVEKGSVSLAKVHSWLASILWPDQDKDDGILTVQLQELERLGKITTPDLLAQRKNEYTFLKIFRIKGILSITCPEDEDTESYCENGLDKRKYAVQSVNDLWDITAMAHRWKQDEQRECKLVIIGRNLNDDVLLSGFRSCFQ